MTTPTTKTEKFTGDRYDVTLTYDPANGYFEIIAIHKASRRKSSVTNLNHLLSVLFDDVFDWEEITAIAESWLYVKDKKKFKKLVSKARQYFQQVNADLEDALEEDMKEGGWNSKDHGGKTEGINFQVDAPACAVDPTMTRDA
jgi:hypothetical protein